MRRLDRQLPRAAFEVLEDQSEAGLETAIARLSQQADVIVIDTPGRDGLARGRRPIRWSRR
jgi:chromosome partitioning protein